MSDPTDPQQIAKLAELLRGYEFDGVARGFPDVVDVLHRAADALEFLAALEKVGASDQVMEAARKAAADLKRHPPPHPSRPNNPPSSERGPIS